MSEEERKKNPNKTTKNKTTIHTEKTPPKTSTLNDNYFMLIHNSD